MKKKSLKQQSKQAPQYGLYMEGLGWLANQQDLTGVIFTEHKELAMSFAEGFDDPRMKLAAWNTAFKIRFKINDIKFEAIYL